MLLFYIHPIVKLCMFEELLEFLDTKGVHMIFIEKNVVKIVFLYWKDWFEIVALIIHVKMTQMN